MPATAKMNKYKLGWTIIIAAFLTVTLLDYTIRGLTNNGLATELFWLLILLPTTIACYFFYQYFSKNTHYLKQILFLALNILIIFISYATLSYLYVILSGIDSI